MYRTAMACARSQKKQKHFLVRRKFRLSSPRNGAYMATLWDTFFLLHEFCEGMNIESFSTKTVIGCKTAQRAL